MSAAVIRRSLGVLAGALVFAGSAHAAAISIDTPANNGYTNSFTPTLHFSDAPAGATISLYVNGSTTADAIVHLGAQETGGTITPADPIATGPDQGADLRLSDGTPADDGEELVAVDVVPTISAPATNTIVDPSAVTIAAGGAIPSQPVDATFAPQDGGSAISAGSLTASSFGGVTASEAGLLAPGKYALTMSSVDAAGVESDAADRNFYVAPPQPAIAFGDETILNQSRPEVTVSGVLAGATVQVDRLDGNGDPVEVGEATASAGTVQVPVTTALSDGPQTLFAAQTVHETDLAVSSDGIGGNAAGNAYRVTSVTVRTTPPALSSADAMGGAAISDSRPSFVIAGGPQTVPGSTAGVEFFLSGPQGATQQTGLVATDAEGTTTWRPSGFLADGTWTVSARSVDDTGHVGDTASTGLTFTVDTTAPSAPAVVSPAAGSTVTTGSPEIKVAGDPGSQLCVSLDAGTDAEQDLTCETARADGAATFTAPAALSPGAHTLTVTSRDAAHNTSTTQATFTVAAAATTPPGASVPGAGSSPGAGTTPGAGPATTTAPARTPKRTKPVPAPPKAMTVSSHTLRAGSPVRLGFSLSAPGPVTVTITRTGRGKPVVVGTKVLHETKRGHHSLRLTTRFAGHTLRRGSYRVSVRSGRGRAASRAIRTALRVV